MKNILITGITGQDGTFLTKQLLESSEDIFIYGTSRNKNLNTFYKNLNYLNVSKFDRLKILNVELEDSNNVKNMISEVSPNMIFNFTGPSSVTKSLVNPNRTINQINNIFDNLINSLVEQKNFCRFFQSSTSEMFAVNEETNLNEKSAFKPNSPYASAKFECHEKVIELSSKYDWEIVSGIMFNHESEFRKKEFLIMKIITTALQIKHSNKNELEVGSLSYIRDWLHAEDTVNAIRIIMNKPKNNNYVIGSGIGHSIEDVVKFVFNYLNLEYLEHIKVNSSLLRKGDSERIVANPQQLKNDYGWKLKYSFEETLIRLIDYKMSKNLY